MAFMQKLFNNSAKKIPILQNKNEIDDSSANDEDYNEYWEAFKSRNIHNTVNDDTQCPLVRLVVRKETNFQNRRTLFDSSNVKRQIIKGKDIEEYKKYDDISGCFGYQVSCSNCENEKDTAEMIFGSLPFSGLDECIKLHRMNGSMIWSLVFKPKYDTTEKESNGSLSSVGSNMFSSDFPRQPFSNKGNLRNTCQSDSGLCLNQGNQIQTKQGSNSSSNLQFKKVKVPSVSVMPPEVINYKDHNTSIANTINSSSGVVSPVPICSINVIKATSSSISTVATSVSKTSHSTLSSFCKNDSRKSNRYCQSQLSNKQFTTSLTSSGISVASRSSSLWSTSTQQGKNSSQNLLRVSSGDLMKRQQRRIRISISLIITASEDKSDELLKHFSFIQESLYKLKRTCCEFISYKKHFIHGMYEAWMKTMQDANNFFFTERLNTTALNILRNKKDTKRLNSFVSEFVHLRNILDTKDSKFMFSTLLTACLTYNLGWVKRFDQRLMKTVASKNSSKIGTKLDNNSALSKTIILSSDSTILKRLIFVLTYFVRSNNFENDLHFCENEENGPMDKVMHDPRLDNEKVHLSNVRSRVNLSSIVDGNKDREYSGQYESSFPCNNVDDIKSASSNQTIETERKVSFVVGAFQDNSNEHEKRCITKHDKYMKLKNGKDDIEKEEQVLLVALPKFFSSKSPIHLPDRENSRTMFDAPFITCGSNIIPGCTIQGLQISDKYNYASSEDLQILRMNEKKELFRDACIPCSIKRNKRTTSETHDNGFICIFGDLDTNDVEIHSQKYTSLNHSNSSTLEGYVSLSPMVANTVDSIVEVSKILNVNQVIDHIENSLYAIYCQSILLSTHLLQSENLQTLDQLSKDLDLDRNDIPILMSIASVHTPELTERYKLSFSF